MSYYKLKTPSGTRHNFVKVDGDTTAEEQISEYFFEGCEIELWNTYHMFDDEYVRDVSISEIREKLDE